MAFQISPLTGAGLSAALLGMIFCWPREYQGISSELRYDDSRRSGVILADRLQPRARDDYRTVERGRNESESYFETNEFTGLDFEGLGYIAQQRYAQWNEIRESYVSLKFQGLGPNHPEMRGLAAEGMSLSGEIWQLLIR